MEDDAPIIDAPAFIRDLAKEERFQAIIFDKTLGPNSNGEETNEEDGEDFSAKCLNDSGEGLEMTRRDGESQTSTECDDDIETGGPPPSGEVY